jgi:hypothetical protein
LPAVSMARLNKPSSQRLSTAEWLVTLGSSDPASPQGAGFQRDQLRC